MPDLLFAHQLEALRARQRVEAEEALGKVTLRRRRVPEPDQLTPRGPGRRTAIDWWAASFLADWSRWSSDVRIPFLGITSIAKSEVPRAADGRTHTRYPDQAKVAEGHFGYIERQDRAAKSALGHGDYIGREEVRDRDEDEGYYGHVLTNIHPNPAVRRDFARRVWAAEREPRAPHLLAWSSDAQWWAAQAAMDGAPQWVRDAADLVKSAAHEADAKACAKDRSGKPFQVDLGEVSPEDAYARLNWIDRQAGAGGALPKLDFASRYGGRVQYRLVYELPFGLTGKQRFEVARAIARWCKQSRFMYVIAIHRPDAHNDPRNYHLHIDVYDRPCRWLKRFGMWDFEVEVKARNGDVRYPHRQRKVAWFSRDTSEQLNRPDYGKKLVEDLRRKFVDLTNAVLETTPLLLRYHAGPAEDLKLVITPTKKLGGRKMAAERHGVRTPEGDHNAEAIWGDRLAAIDLTLADARKQDEERVEKVRKALKASRRLHNDNGLKLAAAVEEWAAELAGVRELRHHIERTDTEFARARSRAEAVLREAAKASEREQTERAFRTSEFASRRADLIAEAKEHLDLVRAMAPAPATIEVERGAVAQRAEAAASWGEQINHAVAALETEPKQNHIRLDLAEISAPSPRGELGRYGRLEIEDRIGSYLNANLGRISRQDGFLVIEAPQAILTLLAKHRGKAELKEMLLAAATPEQVKPQQSPAAVPVIPVIDAVPAAPPPAAITKAADAPNALKTPDRETTASQRRNNDVSGLRSREPAITEDELLAANARIDTLLSEIQEKRWSVFRGLKGYQVSPGRFEDRPDDWAVLSRSLADERVQERLGRIRADQAQEIAQVVEGVEALPEIVATDDGFLDHCAIADMQELVKAWQFRSEVMEAVKKRQAAIALEREVNNRAETPAPSTLLQEVSQEAAPTDTSEYEPAVLPRMDGSVTSADAVVNIAGTNPAGGIGGAAPTIPDGRRGAGADRASGHHDIPPLREDRDSRLQVAGQRVAPDAASARNRLEERIRAGQVQKSEPSSFTTELARSMARERSRVAASDGVRKCVVSKGAAEGASEEADAKMPEQAIEVEQPLATEAAKTGPLQKDRRTEGGDVTETGEKLQWGRVAPKVGKAATNAIEEHGLEQARNPVLPTELAAETEGEGEEIDAAVLHAASLARGQRTSR